MGGIISGKIVGAAQITGRVCASSISAGDYTITIDPIEGGYRLSVTRGSDVQTMDLMDGKSGDDGKSSYIHIRYSTVENPETGDQMSDVPSDYIGIYVDDVATDSSDPADYKWMRFKGVPGEPGQDAPQESVFYTPQTLTTEQQTQARENIGAADAVAVNELKGEKADQFTVGDGLTMSDDRVLSKNDRVTHKLVKSVTIETAVAAIALDGFSLRNAIVEFIAPVATAAAPIFVYINDIASVNFAAGISNVNETASLMHVNTLSGKIRVTDTLVSGVARFGQESTSVRYYCVNGTSTPLDFISKVKAYANKTDAIFPVGTVVNIYEVM